MSYSFQANYLPHEQDQRKVADHLAYFLWSLCYKPSKFTVPYRHRFFKIISLALVLRLHSLIIMLCHDMWTV